MSNHPAEPPDGPVAALFAAFTHQVSASAIDYNGHMTDAAYARVLSNANEVFLEALGLSAAYRATGNSVYTVEMTIRFLNEVRLGDVLRAETRLVSHDTKRVRFLTTLTGDQGRDIATGESLYVHVDAVLGRVVEFPADRMAELDRVQARHDAVPDGPRRDRDSKAVQPAR